jgi:hypothetical protein
MSYQLPEGFAVSTHDDAERAVRIVTVTHRGRSASMGVDLLGLDVAEAQRCAIANLVATLNADRQRTLDENLDAFCDTK